MTPHCLYGKIQKARKLVKAHYSAEETTLHEFWVIRSVKIMAKGQALINEITAQYLKQDVPAFRPGDNVKVSKV